jgi:hypothetical protein
MGEMKSTYSILVGKPQGKRPLVRSGRRWKDIRMGLKETGWGSVDWIHLAQDRDQWQDFVNTVMTQRVLEKAKNLLTS